MSLSNEESLYLFMDGELDSALEESLFSELAYNTELRNEMKDLLFMRNAVKRDDVAPPLFVKDRLISAVGLATATLGAGSGAGTIAVSEFANGAMQWWNTLWFKVAMPVLAGLVGAGAMWVYDNNTTSENRMTENGNGSYASESTMTVLNPNASAQSNSNSNAELSELRQRIAENEQTISTLQSAITKAKQELVSAELRHSAERERLMSANTELYAQSTSTSTVKSTNVQSPQLKQSKNSSPDNSSIKQIEIAGKEQERRELERSYRLAQEQNSESAKEIERLTMNIRGLEAKLAQARAEQSTSVLSQGKQITATASTASTANPIKPTSTYQQSVAQELQSQQAQQVANTANPPIGDGHSFVSAKKGQTHVRLRGVNSQSITQTSLQPQSSSLFDNSYIGTMYQISGGLSAGVEVGRESFAQVYHGRISERLTYVEQYPQLWNVNVILNYRLAEFDVLGPTQLYGETSVGGAVYGGAIVRQSLGLRYDVGNGLSILAAAQAGGMWFQFQNNLFPSYKYGFTYGIQYSFF